MTTNDPSRIRTVSLSCLPMCQRYPQDSCVMWGGARGKKGRVWGRNLEPPETLLSSFLPSFHPQLMTTVLRETSHLERATSAMAPWCSLSALSQASHYLLWYEKGVLPPPPDPCRRYDPHGQGWKVRVLSMMTPIQLSAKTLSALWGWMEVKGWHGYWRSKKLTGRVASEQPGAFPPPFCCRSSAK